MKSDAGWPVRLAQSLKDLISNRSSQPRIRFLDADSGATESADQSLLRRRIRAAAVVLLLARLAILTRSLLLFREVSVLDVPILIGLAAAVVWLYRSGYASAFYLRTIETIIFLGVSLQLGLQLHDSLRSLSLTSDGSAEELATASASFVAAVKDQIIATFGLMMIYGMFIPNTARRAAVMVFLMAAIPGVVIAFNESSLETLAAFRQQHINATGIFSGNLLALAVGAGCAIYGTAMMNRWRNRAIQAEQLGQYRLREKIGSGGMGDVYLAEHRLLRRKCAVKLIRADLSEDPVMLTRFEREVQATATLSHWNTVQVYDYGQTVNGTFFYVMEHLHGRNLRQIVQEHGPMSEARVIFILKQVCSALREAAAHNLVHRDIKPSNIFLACVGERFDVVKLLDFGLVRPLEDVSDAELTRTHDIKGSPRYMCPEQAQGLTPDIRGDIYSLGATAFFLLSGRPPFDLQNSLKLVIAHATETSPTLSEIGVKVSEPLEAIVLKCLRKKPADRFVDPDELLVALEEIPVAEPWSWQIAEDWWTDRTVATDSRAEGEQPAAADTDDALDETVIQAPADAATKAD